jgi:predicted dinucleotide-binding enzyme
MAIGIIGSGNIGTALTRRFCALGHDVAVSNSRGPATLTELATETGATAVYNTEAALGADVIVVTVPEKAVPDLPDGILDGAADDAVVIDTGNYYPQRDGRIEAIETGLTESQWVEQQLGTPVIKAFNNIQSQHLQDLGKPAGTPGRIALPVAGDDARAKAVVMALVEQLGFDAIDAGPLAESWRQQPGTPVYGTDLDAEGVRTALASASSDRPEGFRG